jgi:hypothetical protein
MCSTILGIVNPLTRQTHQERYFSLGTHLGPSGSNGILFDGIQDKNSSIKPEAYCDLLELASSDNDGFSLLGSNITPFPKPSEKHS